ncbi:MAG: type II toxin-antitoxin system HicB family antitoxin [bacterium]|nr:type II toxin-antitoxin system HicB family antitoxin [bacterium]
MKYLNFSVVIEEDKNGFFAFCPEIQGCYTQGETHEEVIKNIKDAIHLHLKDRSTDNEKLERPKFISLSMVEVAV